MMRILTTLILILSLSLSLSVVMNKILFHAFISISAMQSGQNHLGEFEKAPAPASSGLLERQDRPVRSSTLASNETSSENEL